MIPNNPDINDLLTIINKKRKHNKEVIKKEDIIFDLQILSLKKLENMFKDKKLSTRENSKLLNDLEYTMTSLKVGIENTELNKEFDNIHKVMFISLINIYIKEIVDIRKINDNEGRHFNILDYIKNKRTKIENELKKIPSCKRLKKNIINDDDDDDDKKEEEKKKGKENDGKKDDGEENDGEEDDGEKNDGEEDDGEEDDGEEDDGEEDDGEEDEEYGEYDEEYGEYGEYDEEEYNFHNKVTTKLGKEFIKQLYRGKGSPYDLENETVKYFTSMNNKERKNTLDKLKEINNYENNDKPIIFQIMELDLPISQKNHILKNYLTVATSRSDNSKLNQWVENVIKIPIGKYKGINLNSIKPEKVKNFLNDLQKSMDKAAYSHDDAKRQIIQMMGQQIRNPKAKGNILGLWGPPGNGKCFAKDTQILMYDGKYKNVQDIRVYDVVMGDDSKPRIVLSLGEGIDEMYEIKSNKGESYTVNSEHILCLKSYRLNFIKKIKYNNFKLEYFDKTNFKMSYKYFTTFEDASKQLESLTNNEEDKIIEITVKDYLKLPNYIKNKLRGYKTGVEFPKREVQDDAYSLGLFLGCQDTKSFVINQFIPYDYKVNDRETRLKLLAGLIDSNGYYNERMAHFEIIQINKILSDDVLYLARSLGFIAYQYKIIKSFKNDKENNFENYYRIEIYGNKLEEIPSLYLKIEGKENKKTKDSLVYRFEVIHKGKGNYYGFTLDGNNRFLLGDFTVTHNTSLIKEGIAVAMNKPFIFISLGGASDASFLEGHSYTYEGSIYGRIVNGLMTAKCMDPVIYFDELDKISKTSRGDEITNILIHLTDPVQNNHFRDKYFHGIDIDLSKATFIFSFNDPSKVNHILMDRITCVETKYLLISQKIHICKNYLLPAMFKEMCFSENSVIFSDDILRELINKYTHEGGIRDLKSLLYSIVRELNICNLIHTTINDREVKFPFTVEAKDIKTIFKNKREIEPDKINNKPKCGIVNGLWANHLGIGGVLPIEVVWVPAPQAMQVKATGNLEKVIKESTDVATSVAWNYLPEDSKEKFMEMWKNKPMGFHIHCPDGATPKDGPSAGGALTLAIYSLLTHRKIQNNVAMTGEINLQGRISAIGGLEEKLEGAKKAGCVIALVPKENNYDLTKIIDRNPSLLDDKFKVIFIENFGDIIKNALLSSSLTDTPFFKTYYGNDNFDELII
jgi:ATP-dependent Lon protease